MTQRIDHVCSKYCFAETAQKNFGQKLNSEKICASNFDVGLNIMNDCEELEKKYQAALERIAHYEYTIETLRQESASYESAIEMLRKKSLSKDKRISSLEEKLVQMSMELAISKAVEDEHRLANRKLIQMHGRNDDNYGFVNGASAPKRSSIVRSNTIAIDMPLEERRKSIGSQYRELEYRKSDTHAKQVSNNAQPDAPIETCSPDNNPRPKRLESCLSLARLAWGAENSSADTTKENVQDVSAEQEIVTPIVATQETKKEDLPQFESCRPSLLNATGNSFVQKKERGSNRNLVKKERSAPKTPLERGESGRFGIFFRNIGAPKDDSNKTNFDKRTTNVTVTTEELNSLPKRVKSRKPLPEKMQQSSRSFLEGVVFPDSFTDVMKGI